MPWWLKISILLQTALAAVTGLAEGQALAGNIIIISNSMSVC